MSYEAEKMVIFIIIKPKIIKHHHKGPNRRQIAY